MLNIKCLKVPALLLCNSKQTTVMYSCIQCSRPSDVKPPGLSMHQVYQLLIVA